MGYSIAIDGPAGAGKSTIARLVAEKKGFIYVDTGALYRALGVHFMEQGINPNKQEEIIAACTDVHVDIRHVAGAQQVFLNGRNVTEQLRDEAVGKMASATASISQVRQTLLAVQRNLAEEKDVVMDGRDIGTEILPHANVKIFLTASVPVRANRRYEELKRQGIICDIKEIEQDIMNRDLLDTKRVVAPLKKAEDAIFIDSSKMTISEVVTEIVRYTV